MARVQTRQEAQEASQAYKHPRIEPGDSVEFWTTNQRGEVRTKPGCPALIESITGNRTVKLVLLAGGRLNTRYDSVRHIDDPWAAHNDDPMSGIWDYSGQTKRVMELEKKAVILEARLLAAEIATGIVKPPPPEPKKPKAEKTTETKTEEVKA